MRQRSFTRQEIENKVIEINGYISSGMQKLEAYKKANVPPTTITNWRHRHKDLFETPAEIKIYKASASKAEINKRAYIKRKQAQLEPIVTNTVKHSSSSKVIVIVTTASNLKNILNEAL